MDASELSKIPLEGLVQIGKWISYLILLGEGLCVTVAVSRLLGGDEFEIGKLKFSLQRFWMVLTGLTVAHGFLAWVFVQRVADILAHEPSSARAAWAKLTSSEAFVFYNMRPRLWNPAAMPFGGAFIADKADTAFWLTFCFTIGAVVGIALSMVPLDEVKSLRAGYVLQWFSRIGIGCALAGANWLIGSQWAIAASSLLASERASYLDLLFQKS